jgi:predicted permease
VPLGVDVRFDARVYIFLAAATLFVGGLAGIAPVRYSLRRDLASPMKGWTPATASGSPHTRAALVAIQASTSTLLLIMTAILARSVVNASVVDLGFDPERILMVRAVPPSGTCDDACSMTYERLAIERLAGLPEVEAVGVTTSPPMIGALYPLIVQQGGGQELFARVPASADYASAMSLRLAQGRFYTDAEARSGDRVAVVSEALARIVWPAGAALGQPLDHLSDNLAGFRVIAVASDAANSLVPHLRRVGVYVPIDDRATATFMVRTRSDAADVVARAHAAVSAIRPGVRVTTEAMIDVVAAERAPVQAIAGVASTVAFVALGLAVIGLYGITAFVVGQRTREIGVRMALGAGGRNVAGLFARQSLFPVLVGLVTGVGLALAAGHVLSGPILGVSTTDPASYAAAAAVLAAAAAAAIVSPARRAARVDPAAVLRQL